MPIPPSFPITIALLVALALVSLGGGLYEFFVVDPSWPRRPDIIQPGHGGISRKRFWIPAHVLFELVLIFALVTTWSTAGSAILALGRTCESRHDANLVGGLLHSQSPFVRAHRSHLNKGRRRPAVDAPQSSSIPA